MKLDIKFAKNIPDHLDDDKLYISMEYAMAIHNCCCGCGMQVVTPLSPTDWKLTYDGATISLYPSIGNWGLPCQSHYWITNNEVLWAPKWNKMEINMAREAEREEKTNSSHKKKRSLLDFLLRRP